MPRYDVRRIVGARGEGEGGARVCVVYVTVVPPRNHSSRGEIVPGSTDLPPDTPVGVHAGGAEAARARILDRE